MIKAYESTFIVDAHLSNDQIESTVQKFSEVITNNGGSIKTIDRWGKRRLAYEIGKKQYGYYVYIRFDAEGTLIKLLERGYKMDDHVIRYLTVTVPKAVIAQETVMKEKGQMKETVMNTESEISGYDEDAMDAASEDSYSDDKNQESDMDDQKADENE
ncbi:30S ribosomal protein S6 [bacterium]|nr:30S ribosomal protein S6 [bacterium]